MAAQALLLNRLELLSAMYPDLDNSLSNPHFHPIGDFHHGLKKSARAQQ
jgi:hypothetical protein